MKYNEVTSISYFEIHSVAGATNSAEFLVWQLNQYLWFVRLYWNAKPLGGVSFWGGYDVLLPVLLSPKSKGHEIANERNHTTAIITATLLLELYLVL